MINKTLFLCFFFLIITSCKSVASERRNATIILKVNETLEFDFCKSTAHITIKNLSDSEIIIISDLKTNGILKPYSIFKYQVPKKGTMRFFNDHNKSVEINYWIESKREFKIKIDK